MFKPGKVAAAALACAVLLIGTFLGIAVPQASAASTSTWYFAEGYTGSGFQEYLCIANQSRSTASVAADFMFNGGGSKQATFSVGPQSRYTVDVNSVVGPGREVSVALSSANPCLVVERPLYFNYLGKWAGGDTTFGAPALSTAWYFAEGYTGADFDEYVCVLNPGAAAASLTFRFQTASSGEIVKTGLVAAHSRATFKVNDLLGRGFESSLALTSSSPVVAERPMYFSYVDPSGARRRGGDCVVGATVLARQAYFAEGTTRPGFDEWLTLQNPGATSISIGAAYQLGPGQGGPVSKSYLVGPRQRRTVRVAGEVGGGKDVSVMLSSANSFLAERPIYYSYQHSGLNLEGGQCAIGAALPQAEKFFAEGYTGPFFEEWMCIQNTSAATATVQVSYLTQEKGALPPHTLQVGAHSRATVFVNEDAGPNLQVATCVTVLGGSGIVVERPMYFDSGRWQIPTPAPTRGSLYGVCFSPYVTSDPTSGGGVTQGQVSSLLDKTSQYSGWIRTFGSEGEWAWMPALARARGMKIAGGCDIYTDLSRNANEVAALVGQAKARQVDYAVVGDEVLLGNVLGEDQLIGYINQVRAAGVPTGTSDSWTEWLSHPRLVAACDVILMNVYPYWEGQTVEGAAACVESAYQQVKQVAGAKTVIVETGWPSGGDTVGGAVPSFDNSARFLSEFAGWAAAHGVAYFYFEAFDEPWKASREGACGAAWGLWQSNGILKPQIAQVISTRQ